MHAHRFLRMLESGEQCIAKGVCDCGYVGFFIDYYGDIGTKGLNLESLKLRVSQLNGDSEADWKQKQEVVLVKSKENVAQDLSKIDPILSALPEKPNGSWNVVKYYERNYSQILEECSKYGKVFVMNRWEISYHGWLNLCAKHPELSKIPLKFGPSMPKIMKKGSKKIKITQETPKIVPGNNHIFKVFETFPDFPPFSPSWNSELQVEWVRTYGVLAQSYTLKVNA